MCRKSYRCTILGDDPSLWSKTSPLPPPEWFQDQILLFRDVVQTASAGERTIAVELLRQIRSDEMRSWFDEHGQMSGKHRAKSLGVTTPVFPSSEFDLIRSPAKFEKSVFQRDAYRCRYCGLRQVAKEVLAAFERVVGTSEFRTQGTNAQQHGIVHGFKVVADHVLPYKRGGRTDLQNLVSACPACNYGKDGYTIEQLGIEDPRTRPPLGDWDGLTSFLPQLRIFSQQNAPITS